ncbi:MAG: RNA polymerase sigma factor RpoE [Wenzhouxiangellaceae bacterium]
MNMNSRNQQIWDEYLVLHAQAGDQRALQRLLARHQAALLSYVLRLSGDPEAARDICQDAMLACCRRLTSLRDPARFRAWLFRIATHRCRDWQRSDYRRRSREIAADDVDLNDVEAGLPTNADQQQAVAETLARLPRPTRALLGLFYVQGFTITELAETLDMTPGAVKTRLYRARTQFSRIWNGEDHE